MSILRLDGELAYAALQKRIKTAAREPTSPPVVGTANAQDKPSKYGNRRTDGYASAKEAKRAAELRTLEAAGDIRDLREQVSYELIPRLYDGKKLIERECRYVADFVYEERNGIEWRQIVEDCKGMRTVLYKVKRKLLLFRYGIRIKET